ncbi:MAG: hypothetical protein KDE14_11885 [Rhodobacteraceae bacterium]|nr:hypothetical protein [Paracoccaceae bacterium]
MTKSMPSQSQAPIWRATLRGAATAAALSLAAGALAWAAPGTARAQNFIATPGDVDRNPAPAAPRAPTANDPDFKLEQFPDKLPRATNECVFFRTLYDWRPLNNRNLIIWAPNRRSPYHLELDRPCFGLKFAHSIGFTSRDSRLCGFGGDSVLVQSGGGMPERCPIGAITPLTEEGLQALLDQAPGRSLKEKRAATDRD